MSTNKKSDVTAKATFCKYLTSQGYTNVHITAAPCDIIAEKDGATWYFEIKMTRRQKTYFGASTLTEWLQAMMDPAHFRFVVIVLDDNDNVILPYHIYTPAEFMQFSTIPPFKFFFTIPLVENKDKKTKKVNPDRATVYLDEAKLAILADIYKKLKE